MPQYIFFTTHHDCPAEHTRLDKVEIVELDSDEQADELQAKLEELYSELHDGDDCYRTVYYDQKPDTIYTPSELLAEVTSFVDKGGDFPDDDYSDDD